MRLRVTVDRIVTLLLAASALLLVLWQRVGDRWGWLGMLNAWAEWTQRATLALAGLLLWRGHPVRALLALPGVVATPLRIPHAVASAEATSAPFTLLSANLYIKNQRIERHVDLVKAIGPDILCFQEFKPSFEAAFEAGLASDYPFRACDSHVDAFGFGIYSRLPIEESVIWSEPGVRPFAQRVYVCLPDGSRFALYNVHLCPPTADSTMERGLTWGFRTREAQVAFLQDAIQQDGLPAVVIGDHNFSEPSEAYRLALTRWQDAWHQGGRGLRWTWPTRAFPHPILGNLTPLLRLDFCFLSGLQARSLRHLRVRTGSDHRVLLATLERTA